MRTQRYVKPGQRIKTIGNYSEVMCHMRLAGVPVEIELLRKEYDGGRTVYFSGQVYRDGRPAGAPVTYSEAGFYYDSEKDAYYTYEEDGPGDENPDQLIQEAHNMIMDALRASGVSEVPITNLGL